MGVYASTNNTTTMNCIQQVQRTRSVMHAQIYTVYCKLFKVEKFRGLIGDCETFPAKLFRSSFKLEYHS